jgi:hypothetical protein
MNLVQRATSIGGKLIPLVIEHGLTSGTGLMNPSVFIDEDGDILCVLRHVNYTLVHSENKQQFPSRWGPLSYLHPEKDQRLVTENYLCRLNSELEMINYTKVEMLSLHTPIWEFVGLEDARLVQWDNEYSLIGVRRDTTTNGVGRMEKSVIKLDKSNWTAKEVKRTRIPAPAPDNSYCEKNWMPIVDKSNHLVKWTMPTEVVKIDSIEGTCEQVFLKQTPPPPADQRGSSHVIRWGDYYIAVTHEVNLFKNYLKQKDGIYRHRVVVWDHEFNFVGLSDSFSFLDARVEFCVGAAVHEGDLLLSFGFQDNAAFILKTPKALVEKLIKEAINYGN